MKRISAVAIYTYLIILFSSQMTSAQFQTVSIGVNGLTCSQCSRTVELSIRKLDFVADVDMNLQHTEGKVTLVKNSKPDMEKIAQAVINAGFSLRYLTADLLIDNGVVMNSGCIQYNGDQYVYIQAPKEPLKGTVRLKFIGKKYLPKNEFKKVEQYMSMKCGSPTGRVYHIDAIRS